MSSVYLGPTVGSGGSSPITGSSDPLLTRVADDANDSEPMFVVYPASGTEASLAVAGAFSDGNTWTGLWVRSVVAGGAVAIASQINGSSSTTSLGISAGSGGLTLSTSGTIALAANTVLNDGIALGGDTTTAHTYKFQVYDVNGTAYRTWMTATNGDAPDVTFAPPTTGTLVMQATTYKSSDGSSGATGSANNTNTLTIKNGLVTNIA